MAEKKQAVYRRNGVNPPTGRGLGKAPLIPVLLLFLVIPAAALWGQQDPAGDLPYPEIKSLLPHDVFLKQLQEDVAFYHVQEKSGKPLPPLSLYTYRVSAGDDFFALSARFNLPQETLATLNRISTPKDLTAGTILLIPTIPGLFLPEKPVSEIENFIQTWRSPPETRGIVLEIPTPRGKERFLFLPGESFHAIERAFFLSILFRSPVAGGRVTSWYGNRKSPISGEIHFHNGIDIAAPRGTPVSAAREGTVTACGWDGIFGNYIRILHAGGYETFYGHLDSCFVRLNQKVSSSMIIGEVGDTGLSTGPHLHFELRSSRESLNPEAYLPGVKK